MLIGLLTVYYIYHEVVNRIKNILSVVQNGKEKAATDLGLSML